MTARSEFKIGFNTSPYGVEAAPGVAMALDIVIERLARIGYDAVEIEASAPHAWPPYLTEARVGDIRRALAQNDVEACSVCCALGGGPGLSPASPEPRERAEHVNHARACIDFAAGIGAKIVIWCAGRVVAPTSRQQALRWALGCLESVAEYAARKGVLVVVEPRSAGMDLVESKDDAIAVVNSLRSPNVALMLDTFHVHYRGERVSDWVHAMGEHLKHVHLSDSGRLPPGDGTIEFSDVFGALRGIDYRGYVVAEVFGREPDEIARRALSSLRNMSRFD